MPMGVPRMFFFVVPGLLFCGWAWFAVPFALPAMFQALFFWFGVTLVCAGVGTHWRLPALTGKNLDGTIPAFSLFFWLPYFAMLQVYVHVYFRRIKYRGFPIITKIHDGWFLGGWPHSESVLLPELKDNEFILVDLTCELPKWIETRKEFYINVPCWDGTGPEVKDFTQQVTRVVQLQKQTGKNVYVHCGFGRGRSLTFLLACLVEAGVHPDWEKAYAHVLSVRNIVHLPSALRPILLEWAKNFKPKAS